jgi:hypothetical protein
MSDKAYSSAANRAYLRSRGIKAVIPVKEDQKPSGANAAATEAARRSWTPSAARNAAPRNWFGGLARWTSSRRRSGL